MKIAVPILILLLLGCNPHADKEGPAIIANGQMPAISSDARDNLHLTYGTGDSIMYIHSNDQGKTFSTPSLISVVPKLAASHTRGPQIAVTSGGLVLTACDASGNIFSFVKEGSSKWKQSNRVNDMDTVAKENLMALSADGNLAFAVWLDLRDKHNKIFGAKSVDGGNTWSKNMMIYASPDKTVCECCKPSVLVKGNNVYVMFRNWIDGNRDLYLVQSNNGGERFGMAAKLGKGSWPLKGCPMDGGGIAVSDTGQIQTVWNRKGKIYAAVPGEAEVELGQGRSCSVESLNGKNVYAWVEEGQVIVLTPKGEKMHLGKGQLPILKCVSNEEIICFWEADKRINKAIIKI